MKKFVIMGNKNAITYKEIFPLIKNNELWAGYTSLNGGRWMIMPDGADVESDRVSTMKNDKGEKLLNIAGVCWFTNLDHKKRHEPLDLYKKYLNKSNDEFPKYDNYDAIEVSKVCDIPMDYDGIIGVPITFLDKYCPEQFEIIGFWNAGTAGEVLGATYCEAVSAKKIITWNGPTVNKQTKYFRILIKRKGT